MKMADMARTKKEMKADMPKPMSMAEEKYPYGTCLHLSTPELKKLGLDVSNLNVGDKINIEAVGEVTSISQSDSESGGANQSCSVQITKMVVDGGDNSSYRKQRKEGWGKPK
jgi:hypothetical protein